MIWLKEAITGPGNQTIVPVGALGFDMAGAVRAATSDTAGAYA